MQFKHAPAAVSAVFDDPNLVSTAGLVPMLRLARSVGLDELTRSRLSVPTDKGANAGAKVMALVAGMLAGADSIDDMNLLRHGGMGRLFDRTYAPSTLGSFLREFRFGHVRQLDAVASRLFANLTSRAPLLQAQPGEPVMVDLDDTIIEVHGYQKQGAGFGYSGVRGLNALLATASTSTSAPVILAQRLRQGKTGSPKGAARIVGDALAVLRRTSAATGVRPLLRADSAFSELFDSGLPEEDEQWAWIETLPAQAGPRPVVLFTHKPVWAYAPEYQNTHLTIGPQSLPRFEAVLAQLDVRAFGSGHLHRYALSEREGAVVVSAPSTAFVHRTAVSADVIGPGLTQLGVVEYQLDDRVLPVFRAPIDIVEPEFLEVEQARIALDAMGVTLPA
ncbi:transposase [Corynebacterium doosanense CAU 212 = DSM 45436]|uniref:Transposase n=1 Tax=Corynebacterium doosanense CAU 212 = DSM 45436 TaxID=558173 RepID=A0A097ID25_9CORY|nr:transposase [Corynebacterium doosanense CAU 212 = DSM 45436]